MLLTIIPANVTANLKRLISSQFLIRFPTESVGSKILAHDYLSSFAITTPLSFQMELAGTTPLTQEVG